MQFVDHRAFVRSLGVLFREFDSVLSCCCMLQPPRLEAGIDTLLGIFIEWDASSADAFQYTVVEFTYADRRLGRRNLREDTEYTS